jgi:hypothetical protein
VRPRVLPRPAGHRDALDIEGNFPLLWAYEPTQIGARVRGMNGNDWMAAKLVGLFGLIVLALVAVYFLAVFT